MEAGTRRVIKEYLCARAVWQQIGRMAPVHAGRYEGVARSKWARVLAACGGDEAAAVAAIQAVDEHAEPMPA